MNAWCVIPARYQSTRFPGKPLVLLAGKPMIQWVCEQAASVSTISRVLVATDDSRIADAVTQIGYEAVMTSADHPSGTDRIAEAIGDGSPDVVLNIQGDEPTIATDAIEALLGLYEQKTPPCMATLATPLDPGEAMDPNRVKVVCGQSGQALYFSRAPVPFPRDGQTGNYLLHLGVYAYTPAALRQLVSLPPGRLEQLEKLEQLRALENGIPIQVAITHYRSVGVDTPEDVQEVEKILRASHHSGVPGAAKS